MKYVVIEIQNGVVGNNVWVYDDINNAESKYHSVLTSAAISNVSLHACSLLNDTGFCIKHESYTHEVENTEE